MLRFGIKKEKFSKFPIHFEESLRSSHAFIYFSGVENSVQRFLESARQMEAFFLNKRLVLSVAKPENVLSEVGLLHIRKYY